MKGKTQFTASERDEIRDLLREKTTLDRVGQKVVRDKLRGIGFYISDWSDSFEGFTASDFDALIASGRVETEMSPLSLSTNVDLSILYDDLPTPTGTSTGAELKMSSTTPFTEGWLVENGFEGFVRFADLAGRALDVVSKGPGVYAVVRRDKVPPTFLPRSVGGHFKGRDPAVPVATLQAKWIEDCDTLYIGKAEVLRRRVNEYARYGRGEPVGHQGGRYIWQLESSDELIVCWHEVRDGSARDAEMSLLQSFADLYDGRKPFANIAS